MKYSTDRNLIKDSSRKNISSGIIAGTLGIFGPTIMVIEAASAGGFSYAETISWAYAVLFFGAVLGIVMSMYYRIPVVGAHSITGAAFLVTVTPHFTLPELVGAYIITGLIILLFGISGAFKKVMSWIPKEILSAMLAGIITTYVVGLIPAVQELPMIGIPALIVFFMLIKWDLRIPPMLGAVITSLVLFIILSDWGSVSIGTEAVMPVFEIPSFSLIGALSISIPLAILILSNDITPAVGALERQEYEVPTNRMLTATGIASIAAAFFGGQSANAAGMMTIIASDEEAGDKDKRYVAAVVCSGILLIAGIFAWAIVPLLLDLPDSLTAILVGFVLLGVFGSTLKTSFSDPKYMMSAVFTFIISISGVTIFYVSAPVWALLIGTIMAKTMEK
ncbi:benzoate/H(+) symporter BenE family transporter [Corticicoccus populi]|uniref:Benzoate/H(+) symporter BenE family transporter n=1 Tax=Corticicoccus populi TaxID=1812821 RepID=A0ABW5WX27_9STAP